MPSIPANPALPARGESIGNQVELCRAYIRTAFGDAYADGAVIFEDEGFSGGNLDRSDFKRMMKAARDHQFKAVVVYRLDRISRNISDFSSLIEELGRLEIDFVSIRESFDTSSPMGWAMMYIVSVFSQLERETIASASGTTCTSWPRPAAGWVRVFQHLRVRRDLQLALRGGKIKETIKTQGHGPFGSAPLRCLNNFLCTHTAAVPGLPVPGGKRFPPV